ncbi:MAG: VRR-NUC domain-containing protein [Mangrovibacterium sp.]
MIPTCIKCHRQTPSVLDTEAGPVCFPCFSRSKDPQKAKRVLKHEEADIQADFFEKVKLFFPRLPDRLLFAVPNGGSRHKIEAANMKRQGTKAGVADVILLVPKKGYASLCLEFKTATGRQSDEQKEFQRQAEACGSKYVLVRSTAAAIGAVKEYLK